MAKIYIYYLPFVTLTNGNYLKHFLAIHNEMQFIIITIRNLTRKKNERR